MRFSPSALLGPRALLLGLCLQAAGCGITDAGEPEALRLILDPEAPGPVRLVVSTDVQVVPDTLGGEPQVLIGPGDTLEVTAPFQERYPVAPGEGIHLEALLLDSLALPMEMRVSLDGTLLAVEQLPGPGASASFTYRLERRP